MPLLKLQRSLYAEPDSLSNTFSQPHTKEIVHLIEKIIDTAIEIKDPDTLRGLARCTFSRTAYYRDGALN